MNHQVSSKKKKKKQVLWKCIKGDEWLQVQIRSPSTPPKSPKPKYSKDYSKVLNLIINIAISLADGMWNRKSIIQMYHISTIRNSKSI